jgi:hypothetical protein
MPLLVQIVHQPLDQNPRRLDDAFNVAYRKVVFLIKKQQV